MKQKIISFGILTVLVIAASLAVNQIKTSPKTTLSAETAEYAATIVRIGNKTFDVELALTADQQALGLGERDSLTDNSGMLFVFKPARTTTFWMKDMRFNLDMVWIRDGKVVDITRDAPAPDPQAVPADLPIYSTDQAVDYVLEIKAGSSDELKIGDHVEIVDSRTI